MKNLEVKIQKWPTIPPSEDNAGTGVWPPDCTFKDFFFNGIKLYMLFCNFSLNSTMTILLCHMYFYIFFNGCMILLHMCHILLNYC